jgi:hypothetical protein
MIFRTDTVMYHPIEGARTFRAGEEDHGPAWKPEPHNTPLTFSTMDGTAQPVPIQAADQTEIPADYARLPFFALRSLALKFGPVSDKPSALALIEAELKRRS